MSLIGQLQSLLNKLPLDIIHQLLPVLHLLLVALANLGMLLHHLLSVLIILDSYDLLSKRRMLIPSFTQLLNLVQKPLVLAIELGHQIWIGVVGFPVLDILPHQRQDAV